VQRLRAGAMDIEYPYADAAARRQLLYRLPSVPVPRRLLVLAEAAADDALGDSWGGPITHRALSDPGGLAPGGGALFEAVALPRLAGNAAPLLAAVHGLLVPGGVVIGGVTDRSAARKPQRLRASLIAAGFQQPECWYVQPGMESPMALVPCDALAAKAHFVRAARAARSLYSPPAYVLRLLAARLGIVAWRQTELFFWARKPC
jgi:hypothetical protein